MEEQQAVRARLEERQRQLSVRVGRIEGDLRRPADKDWQEHVTEAENDEVLEGLGESGLKELEDIRAALARLDAGSYGTCSSCDAKIAPRRLEVLPYTTLCIDCAE